MVHGWMNNKRMKETTVSPHVHLDLLISYSLVSEMGSASPNLMIQEKKNVWKKQRGLDPKKVNNGVLYIIIAIKHVAKTNSNNKT